MARDAAVILLWRKLSPNGFFEFTNQANEVDGKLIGKLVIG